MTTAKEQSEQITAAMETYVQLDSEDGSRAEVLGEISRLDPVTKSGLAKIMERADEFEKKFDTLDGRVPEETLQGEVNEFLGGFVQEAKRLKIAVGRKLGHESVSANELGTLVASLRDVQDTQEPVIYR